MAEVIEYDYIHTLPGRLRIKVSEVKCSATNARLVETRLIAMQGINYVSANELTGNVLVLYDEQQTHLREVTDGLRAAGYSLSRPKSKRFRHQARLGERIRQELTMELLKFTVRAAIVALV